MSSPSPHRRRATLIDIILAETVGYDELMDRLDTSHRTVESDLAALRALPDSGLVESKDGRRKLYAWRGPAPHCLDPELTCLTHRELLALIVARGLLRRPQDHAAERPADAYPGWLDGAIDGLLRRAGLDAEAARIAPEAIQVLRFAARDEDPAVLKAVVEAVAVEAPLAFTYTNNQGLEHPAIVRPVRLVMIEGEFHLYGGDGTTHADGRPILKQYRLSRMRDARSATPTEITTAKLPDRIGQARVDERLLDGFGATGTSAGGPGHRVVLAVSPPALPHLDGRTWGLRQRWDDQRDAIAGTAPLPEGWRRLAFTTGGLEECRHWVLSFGTTLRADGPVVLVDWLRGESEALFGGYAPKDAVGSPRAVYRPTVAEAIEEKRARRSRR